MDDLPTLEPGIMISPVPAPAPAPALVPASIANLTFLLAFAPAPPTQPPLKSILKRKREVVISSGDDGNSDLDNGEKEDLPGDGDYRPGRRQSRRRGNRGQFKTARTE
ncbi:hypothetical protein BGZ57DRAFT_855616 [Hyaloscypha finlandica]|nr:hypothetical protein BGZ57DRAFT_855616 [Hyaloscypha finlandica]